ncbi:MAG TPA: hypothetical protein VKU01_20285 [Bryobacteraceae bacterium]|nr:hypothetical protein [Bryobacteraceae bacterium]
MHTTSFFFGRRLLFVLSFLQTALAGELFVAPQDSQPSHAFAQYVASIQRRDAFAESGPVGIVIEASVPSLYKEAGLAAIRRTGENERPEYLVLRMEGDGTVQEEVMARYFELQDHIEELPVSSIAITSANYKFRFQGEVKTGRGKAYVYEITPRKKRAGLIKGQLWMDAETGAEVMVTGRLRAPASLGGGVDLVRETTLQNGSAVARVTHVALAVPRLGRGEVVISEYPLSSRGESGPASNTSSEMQP